MSLVAQIPLAFMSYRGFGANTVEDVVRMAKEKPGALSYGSPAQERRAILRPNSSNCWQVSTFFTCRIVAARPS